MTERESGKHMCAFTIDFYRSGKEGCTRTSQRHQAAYRRIAGRVCAGVDYGLLGPPEKFTTLSPQKAQE
jgi:hypothetical protein